MDPKAFQMSEGTRFIFVLQKEKLRAQERHIAQLVGQGKPWGSYCNTKTLSFPTALSLPGLLTLQTTSQKGREEPECLGTVRPRETLNVHVHPGKQVAMVIL